MPPMVTQSHLTPKYVTLLAGDRMLFLALRLSHRETRWRGSISKRKLLRLDQCGVTRIGSMEEPNIGKLLPQKEPQELPIL